jgi:hypothetical protein
MNTPYPFLMSTYVGILDRFTQDLVRVVAIIN